MACAYDRIRRLSRAGLDVAHFLDEAGAALGPAVPNGTPHLDGPTWYTLDPESLLITSSYGGEGCDLDTTAVMRWEYLDEDVNKYDEALRHPRGVQTLHEATDGEPERSRIYREYMASAGMAQEMLVALRAHTGEFWGALRMNRTFGQPEFDSTEIDFMATVSSHLAEGVRRGLLVGEATDPDLPDAPGLVVLDRHGEVESFSSEARRWLDVLPSETRDGLPPAVAAVAAAAMDGFGGDTPADGTTAHLRSTDGRWVCVHGTALSLDGVTRAAVIVEPARPDRITPLLMAIYGLTAREREVTRLVLHGGSTAQLATELGVSPLTVQQHLKRIFDKVGVHSRRELVATLFYDNFDPRVADNTRRAPLGKPIRGGPLRDQP
jgi:DNA-binding CsgD family transcriptional regulator